MQLPYRASAGSSLSDVLSGWLADEAELGFGDGEADRAVDADGDVIGVGDHDQRARVAGERGRAGVPDQGAGQPAAAGGGMRLDALVARES